MSKIQLQLESLASPEQAMAALEAMRSGETGELSLGDLANQLSLPVPSFEIPTQWAEHANGAVPLAALCALVVGLVLWLVGDRLLRSGTGLLFAVLGAGIGVLLELMNSQTFGMRTMVAGSMGGVGGLCIGYLAAGVLTRAVCMSTGAACALLALAYLGQPPISPAGDESDQLAGAPLASSLETNSPPPVRHQESHGERTYPGSATVIKVAVPRQNQAQVQLNELTRSIEHQRHTAQNATTEVLSGDAASLDAMGESILDQLGTVVPQGWSQEPSKALAAAGLGATCGLVISFLFGGWAKRLAAASLGAALGMVAAGMLLPTVGYTPEPLTLAGAWMVLTVARSAIPGKKAGKESDASA